MERPDGSQSTAIGWMLVAGGLLAAVIASMSEELTPVIIWLAIANLGIGLGVLLVSLGYLVRAIWFLPGRGDLDAPISTPIDKQYDSFGKCDWCGVQVSDPAVPCSAFTPNQLPISRDRVKSSVCRIQLETRGHIA